MNLTLQMIQEKSLFVFFNYVRVLVGLTKIIKIIRKIFWNNFLRLKLLFKISLYNSF